MIDLKAIAAQYQLLDNCLDRKRVDWIVSTLFAEVQRLQKIVYSVKKGRRVAIKVLKDAQKARKA